MAEPKDTGFDPEKIFNEGYSLAKSESDEQLREQIAEQFIAQGFNSDAVKQLLFSEGTDVYAPGRGRRRRGGKRKCSAKQWAKMPQICRGTKGARVRTARHPVMVYDTAPRGGYRAAASRFYQKARSSKRVKGGLKVIMDNLGIVTFGAKFLADYSARAKALGTNAKTGKPHNILTALMYDVENFNAEQAQERVMKVLPTVAAEAVGGMIVKDPRVNKIAMGYGRPASKALLGLAGATLVKAILDPPVIQQNGQERPVINEQLINQSYSPGFFNPVR